MREPKKSIRKQEGSHAKNAPIEKRSAKILIEESPKAPVENAKEILLPTVEELPDYENIESETKYGRHILSHLFNDKRLIVLLVLAVLGLIVWTAAPPIYQKLKLRRAMDFLQQSNTAAEEGNIPKAFALMRKAILMAPNNDQVFRKVRLFNAKLGDPAALNSLQGLTLEKTASTEELLTVADQALQAGNTSVAKTALIQLADNKSVEKTIVEMRILKKEGNLQGAVDLARAEMSSLTALDAEKLLLATAEMTLKTDPVASRKILAQFIGNNSRTGIAALRLRALQQLWRASSAEDANDKVAERILSHPMHTADDELLALDLQIRENPAAKPALLAQMATMRSTGSPDDALAFARWMNRRLYHKEAADFIGRERAASNIDWLLVYLDALAGLENWNEIFTTLDAESISGLSDSIRLLFLARAAKNSGDEGKADESWRELHLGLLYEKPEVLSFVAAYALRIGEAEQATRVYKTMSRRRETALEGFLGLIRSTPRNTPAKELIPIYVELTNDFPMLAEAQNDLAYLKLLTNEDPEGTINFAKEIQKTDPPTLATLSISSLALLKAGRPTDAEAIYDGKSISWNNAPAPWKAVRAAVLHAVGKNMEADALAATIDKKLLRPEEVELLQAREAHSSR